MGQLHRKILATVFLGLYGMLSVSGPSLHSFPVFDHGKAERSETKEAPGRHSDLGNSHDDCLVCHFLAQSQIHHDSTPHDTSELTSPDAVGDAPCLEILHSPLHAHPRAPPQV